MLAYSLISYALYDMYLYKLNSNVKNKCLSITQNFSRDTLYL
jgi:hypothetical protein